MVDAEKLEVGSIIHWERYDALWRIDVAFVDKDRGPSVYELRNQGHKTLGYLCQNVPLTDNLFKQGVLYACPRHAYMLGVSQNVSI